MRRIKETAMPNTISQKMNHVLASFFLLTVLLLFAIIGMFAAYNGHTTTLLHNVTTASEFNQQFKENIDLKMYYYVIESQYSEGLPISEVKAAQNLARSLLTTTTQKDSRLAISSVLNLCENLEEKFYEIRDTNSYDERQIQLENNIYVITSLIQEYMYNYLYCESVYLNTLQSQMRRQLVTQILLIALFCAVLLFVLTRYITKLSKAITQPIALLCTRIQEISSGNLNVSDPIPSPEHEIFILSEGVEQMVARLNTQIQENNEKQASLRRAELALLQAQMNPHFLYNTLDTIVWLIEAQKDDAAVEMVSDLSTFFRLSLSKGDDVITLTEEENHVHSYLQIQQVRYKDILHYTINIAPELGKARIPKLTLQPLVENALYHGVKLKRGMGHIYIMGWGEGDDVVLRVTDDGIGISAERLAQIQNALQTGQRIGFGLSTVHERIRLLFGEGYGLSFSSQENVGTTVTIRIPRTVQTEAGES